MLKRWTLICITLIMFLAAMSTGVVSYAEKQTLFECMLVDFESMKATEGFVSVVDGLDVSYLSEESRLKIVDADMALLGKKSLAVNNANLLFDDVAVNGDTFCMDFTVRADSDFCNNMNVSINSLQPSEKSKSTKNISIFSLCKNTDENTNLIKDAEGNVVFTAEENIRYYVRCEFFRGKDCFNIYVDEILVAENCKLSAKIYSIEDLNIDVKEIEKNDETADELFDSYVLLDNISIYTGKNAYPQRFSAQTIEPLPNVNIPEENKNENIKVYINNVEISFFYQPVEKNDTVYVDLEQILRCVGMSLKEDKSNKKIEISNENIDVKASLNNKNIEINGKNYSLSKAPEKINGTIYVSPNFLSEIFNAKVWWDKNARMIVITTGSYKNDNILRVLGGSFYMNGEPYYDIGVNNANLLSNLLRAYKEDKIDEKLISNVDNELKQMKNAELNTIRVFSYDEDCIDILYNNSSREKYFKAMDKMFELLKKYDIKAVISLGLTKDFVLKQEYIDGEGWIFGTETMLDVIVSPTSESRDNVYDYIDMVVTRYKENQNLLMWEIDSDLNLMADIGEITGDVAFSLLQLADFYGDCADRIRKCDSRHIVSSGDSVLLKNQWNAFKSVIAGEGYTDKKDNLEERIKALSLLNEKLDVVSIHSDGLEFENKIKNSEEKQDIVMADFSLFVNEAKRLNKALYAGYVKSSEDATESSYYDDVQRILNSIISSNVQISHWETTTDKEVLQIVSNENKTLKKKYVVNSAAEENTTDAWSDFAYSVFDENNVSNGSEFTEKADFRSRIIRLIILGSFVILAVIICVIALTGEKIKRKRKDDFVW